MLNADNLNECIGIINACLRARIEEDLEDIWLSLQHLCNIDGVLFFVSESTKDEDLESTIVVRSFGINDSWHDLYVLNKYALIDPVLKMAKENDEVFSWKDAFSKHGAGAEDFISTASELGLREGYSIAIQANDFTGIACATSVTFEGKNLSDDQHHMIKTLIPHLNSILARPGFLKSPNLTDKQLEVLKWAAQNKSYWEIGIIMDISERTVKFHFKNIFRKLGVSSRGEAILKAKIKGTI
jgi:DNA-binding CsgD family transcriptional regulator